MGRKKLSFYKKEQHPFMLILERGLIILHKRKKTNDYSANLSKEKKAELYKKAKLLYRRRKIQIKNKCVYLNCKNCGSVFFPVDLRIKTCDNCNKELYGSLNHKLRNEKYRRKAVLKIYDELNCDFTEKQKMECLKKFESISFTGKNILEYAIYHIYKYSFIECRIKIPYHEIVPLLEKYSKITKFTNLRRKTDFIKGETSCKVSNLIIKYIRQFFKKHEDFSKHINMKQCEEFSTTHYNNLMGKNPITIAVSIIYYLLPFGSSKRRKGHSKRKIYSKVEFVEFCTQASLPISDVSLRKNVKIFDKLEKPQT